MNSFRLIFQAVLVMIACPIFPHFEEVHRTITHTLNDPTKELPKVMVGVCDIPPATSEYLKYFKGAISKPFEVGLNYPHMSPSSHGVLTASIMHSLMPDASLYLIAAAHKWDIIPQKILEHLRQEPKIDVVNLSIGATIADLIPMSSETVHWAKLLRYCLDYKKIIVMSAGNEETEHFGLRNQGGLSCALSHYPELKNALIVTGSMRDNAEDWQGYRPGIIRDRYIMAQGWNVPVNKFGKIKNMTGTSFAAPAVTASLVTLMTTKKLSAPQAAQQLLATANKSFSNQTASAYVGQGTLDLANALSHYPCYSPPINTPGAVLYDLLVNNFGNYAYDPKLLTYIMHIANQSQNDEDNHIIGSAFIEYLLQNKNKLPYALQEELIKISIIYGVSETSPIPSLPEIITIVPERDTKPDWVHDWMRGMLISFYVNRGIKFSPDTIPYTQFYSTVMKSFINSRYSNNQTEIARLYDVVLPSLYVLGTPYRQAQLHQGVLYYLPDLIANAASYIDNIWPLHWITTKLLDGHDQLLKLFSHHFDRKQFVVILERMIKLLAIRGYVDTNAELANKFNTIAESVRKMPIDVSNVPLGMYWTSVLEKLRIECEQAGRQNIKMFSFFSSNIR